MNIMVAVLFMGAGVGLVLGILFSEIIDRKNWRRMDTILSNCLSAQEYKMVRDQMRKRDE